MVTRLSPLCMDSVAAPRRYPGGSTRPRRIDAERERTGRAVRCVAHDGGQSAWAACGRGAYTASARIRLGCGPANLLGTNPGQTRDDHQRAPAHGQRARGRGRRRVRPAYQHKETRLCRKAVCGRCRYRGGNRPVGSIGRARLTAAHWPVQLTGTDHPIPAVLALFARIARLSGFAQSTGLTTAWK
jgi:hypothetical protein